MPTITPLRGKFIYRLNHVELQLRSPELENLFKVLSGDRIKPAVAGKYSDLRRYDVSLNDRGCPTMLAGFDGPRFDMWGDRELLISRPTSSVNLSCLLAVGLGSEDGVKVNIPTVMSTNQRTTFINGLEQAVLKLFVDYIRDASHNWHITATSS